MQNKAAEFSAAKKETENRANKAFLARNQEFQNKGK
jgi:hypothetical protein